jgi:hypothetical protein
MKTHESLDTFSCVQCEKVYPSTGLYLELKCGDSLCSRCSDLMLANEKELYFRCKIHHLSLKEEEISGDPKYHKLSEHFNQETFNCSLHKEPVEYFSKSERRLYCIRCISQFVDSKKEYTNVVSIDLKAVIRDIFKIQLKMNQMFSNLPFYLSKHQTEPDFVSKFLQHSLALIDIIDRKPFHNNLDLFKTLEVSTIGLSTLTNSKIPISKSQIVDKLSENSTIITKLDQEQFVRDLFDKRIELGLLYRASRDGFEAKAFHQACDGRGPTICLFKSDKNKTFGGYSDKSWFSQICFKMSKGSFLFSVDNKKKLKLFRNYDKALFFNKNCGPCFGEDIIIGDTANEPKSCRSFVGRSYETCEGYFESLEAQKSLTGFPAFSLVDYEVYVVRFID